MNNRNERPPLKSRKVHWWTRLAYPFDRGVRRILPRRDRYTCWRGRGTFRRGKDQKHTRQSLQMKATWIAAKADFKR